MGVVNATVEHSDHRWRGAGGGVPCSWGINFWERPIASISVERIVWSFCGEGDGVDVDRLYFALRSPGQHSGLTGTGSVELKEARSDRLERPTCLDCGRCTGVVDD